ncbi:hypothetical protein HMPREF1583_01449 [Gardnerella vaginalis JCP8151B]|nr:hypothetical protein HMPREF1583_01449 [Gardnerella vaginalis JCP8151B]EPI46720.1 hypothetical protein HMPREF1582_00928 [Gardnerella vaginalis JCP8151A]
MNTPKLLFRASLIACVMQDTRDFCYRRINSKKSNIFCFLIKIN